MTTLTQTIKQELLDSVNDTAGLQAVLQKHRHSKGPLYIGLAQATTSLIEKLQTLSQRCGELEKEYQERERQINTQENKLADLNKALEEKNKAMASLDAKAEQNRGLLDQAEALRGLGFGPDELATLHHMLAGTAASVGATPGEAMTIFFQQIDRYQDVVFLDLETKRAETKATQAKAEAERWQAEAKAEEAKTKAHIATINLTDKWLSHGVKEKDFLEWDRILQKTGASPHDLTRALDSYGSLETLCRKRTERAEELQGQLTDSEARLKALHQQEAQVRAGIEATRDGALKEMEKISYQACQHLNVLLQRATQYADLDRQAAQLAEEIPLARAFLRNKPELWAKVSRESIEYLMACVIRWARDGDHNRQVPIPEAIRQRTSLTKPIKISLVDLLIWAFTGIMTEEARRMLASPQ